MHIDILCEGLGFPEGPIIMPDGSVILVEIQRKTLTRIWNGKRETIAEIPGGPNGAALGPDGAIYITNNGGFEYHDIGGLLIPGHAPPDYETGRLERVDLSTGKIDRLYDAIDGQRLSAPMILCSIKAGAIWFTDLGKPIHAASNAAGCITPSPMAHLREIALGGTGLNGVGLSPDERVVMPPKPKLESFGLSI